MSLNGTSMYDQLDQATVPRLVQRAVAAAHDLEFELCVHPGTGRLLQALAAGVAPGGVIGETGTGTGAGLAWMASLADPGVTLLSVEIDRHRAEAAQTVFADQPNVTVIQGDAGELFKRGPYDLLVHDGGWGSGKAGSEVVERSTVLKDGGIMTVDDFAPTGVWPPMFDGEVDQDRTRWLQHPEMLATEIQVAPDMAVVVARWTPGLNAG